MKGRALLTALIVFSPLLPSSALRVPNRGKQLFLLIEGRPYGNTIAAMTPESREFIQEWNQYNPTYDFISAVVQSTGDGCKVRFTRYVMKDDYVPRTEQLDLFFSYREQRPYRFFDDGVWIVGFYRNSVSDIDSNEFRAPSRLRWLNSISLGPMDSDLPVIFASIFLGVGCLLVLVSLPLIFRKVPMNRFYGVRTRASFRSDEDWYDINEYGGRVLMRWSAVIILVGIVGFFLPIRRLDQYVIVGTVVSLFSMLAALVQTLRWVQRRKKAGGV